MLPSGSRSHRERRPHGCVVGGLRIRVAEPSSRRPGGVKSASRFAIDASIVSAHYERNPPIFSACFRLAVRCERSHVTGHIDQG